MKRERRIENEEEEAAIQSHLFSVLAAQVSNKIFLDGDFGYAHCDEKESRTQYCTVSSLR